MRREQLIRTLAVVVVLLAAFVAVVYASSAGAPLTQATNADLVAQQRAAERDLQRVYVAGVDQLKTTRSLKLAIPDSQAAQIEATYTDQLRALRSSALVAVAQAFALTDAQAYAQQTSSRLDSGPVASGDPVMLAPRLYQIVQRMGELTGQLVDAGVKEMTQSMPSPSPSGTPRSSASPSPTR